MKEKLKISPIFLLIALILMVSSIWIVFTAFNTSSDNGMVVKNTEEYRGIHPKLKSQSGMYVGLKDGQKYPEVKKGKTANKNSKGYYERRAYHGAPPRIPHTVKTTMKASFENCLQCHANGGFSKEFAAYAPVTPHPEMLNCRQCHVPQLTKKLFKGTNWKRDGALKIGRAHMQGSPPVMPHGLQMRENCLACHSGQGAQKAIVVTHPERVNCRQCHVPAYKNEKWVRRQK